MLYFRAATTEVGHIKAGHGNFNNMKRRAGVVEASNNDNTGLSDRNNDDNSVERHKDAMSKRLAPHLSNNAEQQSQRF